MGTMRTKSTRKRAGVKPDRPYPDFPMFPHNNGQWARKIKGKRYCFGVWTDPDAALRKYQEQRDDLYAGRVPRERNRAGLRLQDAVKAFLTAKDIEVQSGELAQRSWNDYRQTGAKMLDAFGRSRVVEDLPNWQKRGVGLYWEQFDKIGTNPVTGQSVAAQRRRIKRDFDLPMMDEYGQFVAGLVGGDET